MSEFTVDDPANGDGPPPAPSMAMPILVGAALITGLSLIPFASMTCCLPSILGGLLAIWLYSLKMDGPLEMSKGITIGLVTCLLGGIAAVAVIDLIWVTFDYQIGADSMQGMMMQLGELMGEEVAEQMSEAMEQAAEQALTPGAIGMQLASAAFISAIGGLISGSLGVALFKGSR